MADEDAGPDTDPRHVFIREVQHGRSFIDIGGLQEARTERVSVAAAAGATKLTLMDVEGQDCPWWAGVRERLASKGVSDCEFISGDVMSPKEGDKSLLHPDIDNDPDADRGGSRANLSSRRRGYFHSRLGRKGKSDLPGMVQAPRPPGRVVRGE
jgi:hypothetical protein